MGCDSGSPSGRRIDGLYENQIFVEEEDTDNVLVLQQ